MHLGFMDAQGRAYDLNFRTMKRRLRSLEGDWELEPGEAIGGETSIEVAVFLDAERPHLLMRPTSGTAITTDRRLLFVAGPKVDRTADEPTAFNVSIHVPRTAVDHLLREAGGCEVVEVRKTEVKDVLASRAERTLRAEGPWIGGRTARFLIVLRPAREARAALAPMGL